MPQIIEVTDSRGQVVQPAWLARAEAVHRQLRPKLPPDYAAALRPVFEGGGRMVVAARGERVVGVSIWRHTHKTYANEVYVDDLVTDEALRSTGVGRALLGWIERRARELGCGSLSLDSGTQRQQAHKFYFREGMVVPSFHFHKPIGPG
jgi:GNAT superfamily N-acetyltransferase